MVISQTLQKELTNDESNMFAENIARNIVPTGATGTDIQSGYLAEEYLQALSGKPGMEKFDEMRRSDGQVAMLLNAICNPIKSGQWDFEIEDENDSAYQRHEEVVRQVLFRDIDWEVFLNEVLTFLICGFSLFEIVDRVGENMRLGKYNTVDLAFRSQKTIEKWNINRKTTKLESVTQYAFGDTLQESANQTVVHMPAEHLLLFTNRREGDNFEGISELRPMYGPYIRKEIYLKLAAIGIEKYALGTPIGTIPSSKAKDTEEVAKFRAILRQYTSHEKSFIIKPEGWEIDIQFGDFDASKIKEMILLENTEMVNAVVANFLALGTNGNGGAFALSTDLSDFFLSGIQFYAKQICNVINRVLIPRIVRLNFGPQECYPEIKCTGINDKAGAEMANVVKTLIDGNALTSDDTLEEFLRKAYKLPKQDVSTSREKPAVNNFGAQDPNAIQDMNADQDEGGLEDSAKKKELSEAFFLAENFEKKISQDSEIIKALIQENLEHARDNLLKIARMEWKRSSRKQRVKIATKLKSNYGNKFKTSLREELARIAFENRKAVFSELPKKLSETFHLSAGEGYYGALPEAIKKIVETQAVLVSSSKVADLEKAISFQFASSQSSSDDVDVVLYDVKESADKLISGSTAGGASVGVAAANVVSTIANETRMATFFEPDVLEQIESMTFTNVDPQSDVCKSLVGVTLPIGHPDIVRYGTPLHHNCKSRWEANYKRRKGNPAPQTTGISVTEKVLKSITL